MTEERIKEIVSDIYSKQDPDYYINRGWKSICKFAELCCKAVLETDKEERIAQKRRQNGYRVIDSCQFCAHRHEDSDDNITCDLDGWGTMDIAICNSFELDKTPKNNEL